MDDKELRFVLWFSSAFASVVTILLGCGIYALSDVVASYESWYDLRSARMWLMFAFLLASLGTLYLIIMLMVTEWTDFWAWLKKTYVQCLQWVSRTALDLAAKVSPKPAEPTRAATPAPKPKQPPKPPPPPPKPDPGPPPRPRPTPPPSPKPDPPKPDPTSVPSRRGRGPDDSPDSGAGALPIPPPPIRRMADALVA